MAKLTVSELAELREKLQKERTVREGQARAKVTIHMGTCGISAGARDVMKALLDEIEKRDLHDIEVSTSGCAGLCSREPMATVQLPEQPPVKYGDLTADKMLEILKTHILEGAPVEKYALATGSEKVG